MMERPTIREILRRFSDGLERDDECRPKMRANGVCIRGTERCIAHHSEAWLEWSTEGGHSWAESDGWTAAVSDSEERTSWRVTGPRGERDEGEADTLTSAQLLAEQALARLRPARVASPEG